MAYRIDRQQAAFGENLRAWRMVQQLTARQVCERAGISLATLRSLESGEGKASLETAFQVARALGVLDRIVESTDPLATDLGRARAGLIGRKRVG